jgi:hypothetical protein
MLHTAIIGLSAILLFQIQLIISKKILPSFGGGASIWLTSLIFFQWLLFLGYATCYFLSNRFSPKKHIIIQILLISMSIVFLPLDARYNLVDFENFHPALNITLLLLLSVGMPYFVLSTTSPNIQYWITLDQKIQSTNPYIQYAVSNAGSFIGLLSYPFWMETSFTLKEQSHIWSIGYGIYFLMLLMYLLPLLYQKRMGEFF